ncbi:pyridoxamine 5'-phosphate oxidase family protein [Streptomyces sp. MRC013]|uniref:pyridoxamine 5'-phosphate oxidase family protein n=1 Tax=Streptomyces sp. MRC013 TaxID=2898276 RepID=UPI0020274E64|nr:pyridoxamine 5'-phosphate oxidase family protein [Streptomyces sp. MRC013]URM92002.1 pyridoxamine 5'-phosphate oxidase family protein [Streptomyces sp. MRC013]
MQRPAWFVKTVRPAPGGGPGCGDPRTGRRYAAVEGRIRTFTEEQPVFFAATAPLAGDGHVDVSPEGRGGTPVVVDGLTLPHPDFGGSNAEAIAHLREPGNGRITPTWCAFGGPPKAPRVHGTGEAVLRDGPRRDGCVGHFEGAGGPSARAIAVVGVRVRRVGDSCGFAVPFTDHREERTRHAEHFARKTDGEFAAYRERKEHVGRSLDGLPALPPPLPPGTDAPGTR